MKRLLCVGLALSVLALGAKKDKAGEYQVGIFASSVRADDGTITSTIHGDGTTVAGGVYANHVGLYTIRVPDGIWVAETKRQALDSWTRNMGWTPSHRSAEKPNPLDFLKKGDKVLFRVETHKKINLTEIDMFVPFADRPDKEESFVATFTPDRLSAEQPIRPTDNVKAVCDSGRLSAELKSRYCQ